MTRRTISLFTKEQKDIKYCLKFAWYFSKYLICLDDLVSGSRQNGNRMSPVRRTFLLLCTFDLVFLTFLWLIAILVTGTLWYYTHIIYKNFLQILLTDSESTFCLPFMKETSSQRPWTKILKFAFRFALGIITD